MTGNRWISATRHPWHCTALKSRCGGARAAATTLAVHDHHRTRPEAPSRRRRNELLPGDSTILAGALSGDMTPFVAFLAWHLSV
jgi:hypothetical protein